MSGLLELQYGQDVVDELKKVSEKVSWAQGWPYDKVSFWNAEAFMWDHKIEKDKRLLIANELNTLIRGCGKNLDVGCGAYSYISSVGYDISEKMLDFNDNCIEKVQGDLEGSLPFSEKSFASVTATFVLNYVENYGLLFSEIKRVLAEKGIFVMILSAIGVNEWQRQKQVNNLSCERWAKLLEEIGFKVKFYEKEDLWFFVCGVGK